MCVENNSILEMEFRCCIQEVYTWLYSPPPQSPKRTSFADSLLCVRTSGCVCVLKDGLLLSNAGIASVTHNFGWAWFSALRKLT